MVPTYPKGNKKTLTIRVKVRFALDTQFMLSEKRVLNARASH